MMDKASHSSTCVLLPEEVDREEEAREWKDAFIKTAISDEPEEDEEEEEKDYTEAMYDCLCDIGDSLRLISGALTKIEDKLK